MKAGRNCLLPYVQKLVTMQCNELGFRKLQGYYAKSSKNVNSECRTSLHEVRCHLRKTCTFQRDLTILRVKLSKFVLLSEGQSDFDKIWRETWSFRYERDVCWYLKFYANFFFYGGRK